MEQVNDQYIVFGKLSSTQYKQQYLVSPFDRTSSIVAPIKSVLHLTVYSKWPQSKKQQQTMHILGLPLTHECGPCAFVCGTYMGNTKWQNRMKLCHAVIGYHESRSYQLHLMDLHRIFRIWYLICLPLETWIHILLSMLQITKCRACETCLHLRDLLSFSYYCVIYYCVIYARGCRYFMGCILGYCKHKKEITID